MRLLLIIMCDTFVAINSATKDGSVILGKNSDRQPNEPQETLRIPRVETTEDEVKCTYISIPQEDVTYAVVLSKPNWIWGAEMGYNENGVAIGNEAVWSIFDKHNRKERLIGMDMLRLALERSKSAKEAFQVITELLDTYGQGGNCGFSKPEYYDNSFIIADQEEAWILETAGKFWIAEKVKDIRSISNTLTIEQEYDAIHPDLLNHAINTKRCKSEEEFNFKAQYSDRFNITRIGAKGDTRASCTYNSLRKSNGEITLEVAFETLRDHNSSPENFNPRSSSMASPCLHASSFLTPSQSTASMVAHLGDHPLGWFTGTSTPCLSIFKPVPVDGIRWGEALPSKYEENESHLWWEHERLHRSTIQNYQDKTEMYLSSFRDYEEELIAKTKNSKDVDMNSLHLEAFIHHKDLIQDARTKLEHVSNSSSILDTRYRRYWRLLNRKAGISIE